MYNTDFRQTVAQSTEYYMYIHPVLKLDTCWSLHYMQGVFYGYFMDVLCLCISCMVYRECRVHMYGEI